MNDRVDRTKIPSVFADGDPANADWTKRSWDFPGRSPEQVARLLLPADATNVDGIAQLPVIVWNPEQAGPVLDAARGYSPTGCSVPTPSSQAS